MDYGVGVKNKFDLFDQDITDPDFIHIGAKKQGHPKTTDKKPLQKSTVTAEKNKQVTVKSAPVKATVQKTVVNDVKARSNDTRDSNRRNDKGNRFDKRTGGSGKERSGKREFDRKSGSDKSGVKPVEKREGFGKSNWGNFTEDAETTQEQPTELNNDEELNNNNEEIENVEPAGPEEPKVLTLEEYRKQEQEKRLVPKFNIRKPGEGDTQQWKKGYVLKKEDEEEEQVVVYEEIEVEEKQQGRHKKILDIDITFRDGHRNGNFRGDRRRDGRGPRKDFGDKRGDRPFRDGGDKEHREERPPRRDGDRPPRDENKRRNHENSDEKEAGKPFKGGFRDRRRDGEEGGFRERRRDGEEGGFRERRRDGEEGGFRERRRDFNRDGEEGEEKSDRPPRRDFNRKREDRQPREEGEHKEHREERPPRRDGDRPPRDRGDRPPRRDGDRAPRDGDNNRGPRRQPGFFRKGGKASAPKFDDLNDLNQFPSLGLGGTKVEN